MGLELAELVAAAKAGDRQAFEGLVRSTCADTYTLAYRLTGNQEDAQDVVQEAYLRAWKGMKRYRGEAAFTTWLYRITANCASTHLARRSRHRHDSLGDDPVVPDESPEADPEARLGASSERERLNAALQGLPAEMRAVVVLRDVYDLPHEVIAAELGISEGAAKVRLHRARRKLRERLFPLRGEESGERDAHAV
ncbi:MAG: sigma-70 family RNA polymerase sigma factor [Actinomycetota bacterium]|nr:sigma-70 family RNA polymerase sigma factor [Actinomycetota bacterium]